MTRLLRDPFLWGSVAFVILFPALDLYVLEKNYYDNGFYFPFVIPGLALWGLWAIWLLICVFITIRRLRNWRWTDAGPLVMAVVAFLSSNMLGSTIIWQHYNFFKFHQARLDYARRGDGSWGQCKGTPRAWDSRSYPALSIEGTEPEVFGTASGPYVYYAAFTGIPDGMWGFLYAPSLDDPMKALPQLNLEFALLWDREACVFLAGNR